MQEYQMVINYSIIIPHKNSSAKLQRCLNSIPARDDVEVIVVDDNSDADKVDFEQFPKWTGCNYKYFFTKEGRGAGYARNVALKHATGKWILFVDADDYLLPTINKIFDDVAETEADIVFFPPTAVMEDNLSLPSHRADGYINLLNEFLATGEETKIRLFWMSPCSKIIRHEIIKDIKFDEIRYSNDNYFSVAAACRAKKIEAQQTPYYTITQSTNSLTSNMFNKPGELECRATGFLHAIFEARRYNLDISLSKDFCLFYLSQLHKKNWSLYTEYFQLLRSIGVSGKQMLRNQFQNRNRLGRWKGYLVSLLHIVMHTIKK